MCKLRKFRCEKCGEEFWYKDDSITKVYCKNGNLMKELDNID